MTLSCLTGICTELLQDEAARGCFAFCCITALTKPLSRNQKGRCRQLCCTLSCLRAIICPSAVWDLLACSQSLEEAASSRRSCDFITSQSYLNCRHTASPSSARCITRRLGVSLFAAAPDRPVTRGDSCCCCGCFRCTLRCQRCLR